VATNSYAIRLAGEFVFGYSTGVPFAERAGPLQTSFGGPALFPLSRGRLRLVMARRLHPRAAEAARSHASLSSLRSHTDPRTTWPGTVPGVKRPFSFHRRDGQPSAFAGLWEAPPGPDGPAETCAILTADANELTRAVHDRMPVMLTTGTGAAWIDPVVNDPEALQALLKPFPAEEAPFTRSAGW
jgi:hypothetical protein